MGGDGWGKTDEGRGKYTGEVWEVPKLGVAMGMDWEVEGDGSTSRRGFVWWFSGVSEVGYLEMVCIPKSYPLIP